MTVRKPAVNRARSVAVPRVGLFGHLGACNIGNDASMEAVLRYLRANYPGAIIDAMCPGPEQVSDRYGIRGVRMVWYHKYEQRVSGMPGSVINWRKGNRHRADRGLGPPS